MLEYIGPRKWVDETLAHNKIKGTFVFSSTKRINEAVLGDLPEFIAEDKYGKPTFQRIAEALARDPNAKKFD